MADSYVEAIRKSGRSIYDKLPPGDPLWIPTAKLEAILHSALKGVSVAGLANRTRSKFVKEQICQALGYQVPSSFKKTQPRFPCQQFDTYVQKALNLQIWNEEVSPTRRYVLVGVNSESEIYRVKVVTGAVIARLDTTGKLTQKYQARCDPGAAGAELVTPTDTDRLRPWLSTTSRAIGSPMGWPAIGDVIPIAEVFEHLKGLIGATFADAGHDQERVRGEVVERLASTALGHAGYQDDGQFPDIRRQLLEIKLQTAHTIDLGRVTPDSEDELQMPTEEGADPLRHCDVRYGVLYGETDGSNVTLTHLFLTTGREFFSRFPRFEGNVVNKKIQIPLPRDFFLT